MIKATDKVICYELLSLTKITETHKIFIKIYLSPWLNPFFPNAPFFYPLKTSENLTIFWCFQGVEKGCIGNEWVNVLSSLKTSWQAVLTRNEKPDLNQQWIRWKGNASVAIFVTDCLSTKTMLEMGFKKTQEMLFK